MSKYIRATQKTKSKIRETFWQIYQKKPIEKISVRESQKRRITTEAPSNIILTSIPYWRRSRNAV